MVQSIHPSFSGSGANRAVCLGLVLVLGHSAFAQEAEQTDGLPAIEEIVVTAQKREQSVMDVPVTMSVFSGDFIDRSTMSNPKELANLTPGLGGVTRDSFVDYISVRGITTNDFGVGGDPSVGIYKNGMYQGRTGSAVTSFYDIERVEVLRGPQGLLFGRNAASGAIAIITAKPNTDAVEGYASLDVGERGHTVLEAGVNVPLSDEWALRAAGFRSSESGYSSNDFCCRDLVEHDIRAARWSLAYDGDSPWSGFLMIEGENRDLSATIYRAFDDSLIGTGSEDVNTDLANANKDHGNVYNGVLQVAYDFGFATLTSITGHRRSDYEYLEDFDGTPLLINNYWQNQNNRYWSQELKLVSNNPSRLQWFAGVSAYREEIHAYFYNQSDENLQCLFYLDELCEDVYEDEYGEPWPGYDPNGLLEDNQADGVYEGWAVYGNLSYQVTDRLRAEVGLRYTYDEKDFELEIFEPTSALGAFYNFGLWTDGPVDDKEDWDEWTPRYALSYDFSDTQTLFATASKGYKSGGFSTFTVELPPGSDFIPFESDPPAPPGTRPDAFDPETLWNYEAGLKSLWMDDRLQTNVSVFYYEYEDLQISFFDGSLTLVENVGQVDGQGFEADLRFKPTPNWDLYAGVSYLDTEVDDVPPEVCTDCSGNDLTVAPEWTYAVLGTYTHPIRWGDVFFTGEYHWQDKQYSDLDNSNLIAVDSYGVASFRLGLEEPGGKWSGSVYVENAFDEFYWDLGGPGEEIIPPHMFGPARPRTWGASLNYNF